MSLAKACSQLTYDGLLSSLAASLPASAVLDYISAEGLTGDGRVCVRLLHLPAECQRALLTYLAVEADRLCPSNLGHLLAAFLARSEDAWGRRQACAIVDYAAALWPDCPALAQAQSACGGAATATAAAPAATNSSSSPASSTSTSSTTITTRVPALDAWEASDGVEVSPSVLCDRRDAYYSAIVQRLGLPPRSTPPLQGLLYHQPAPPPQPAARNTHRDHYARSSMSFMLGMKRPRRQPSFGGGDGMASVKGTTNLSVEAGEGSGDGRGDGKICESSNANESDTTHRGSSTSTVSSTASTASSEAPRLGGKKRRGVAYGDSLASARASEGRTTGSGGGGNGRPNIVHGGGVGTRHQQHQPHSQLQTQQQSQGDSQEKNGCDAVEPVEATEAEAAEARVMPSCSEGIRTASISLRDSAPNPPREQRASPVAAALPLPPLGTNAPPTGSEARDATAMIVKVLVEAANEPSVCDYGLDDYDGAATHGGRHGSAHAGPFGEVCEYLDLAYTWGPEVVAAVSSAFLSSEVSTQDCATFIRSAVFPAVATLPRPASRALLGAITAATKIDPSSLVSTLLYPILRLPPDQLGSAQCEVVQRTVKTVLPREHAVQLLALLLELEGTGSGGHHSGGSGGSGGGGGAAGGSGGGGHMELTELTIPVLQSILSPRLELPSRLLAALCAWLDRASSHHASAVNTSLKFSSLLLLLVSKYGMMLRPHRVAVERVVRRTKTFMAKPILAALAKIT